MKEALRGVLEDMAQQEEAVQSDLEQKAEVILAQQKQIAVLDAAVQVTCCFFQPALAKSGLSRLRAKINLPFLAVTAVQGCPVESR